ncbi:membrane protein [Polymorphobacter glacialis]|uniref:Membrane protein n=1 Tax=Sandarakinorhabdus glacialis TaxID=1614636 RepID=A0A916ZP64_9SPHN|nr:membrane protein [Polymorphobacter glacialis]
MTIWGLVVGAVLGWLSADSVAVGLVFGGLAGALAAKWLAKSIRDVVRAETEAVFDDLSAQLAVVQMGAAVPPAPKPVPPPMVLEPVAIGRDTVTDSVALPFAASERTFRPMPVADDGPGVMASALDTARAWLLGGNTIVRVGLIILFVGLSFLARYAAMAGMFPIEVRLALVGAAGVALLGVGLLRRAARPAFALALQGAGVGVIYMTVFAAARLFEIVSPTAALVLMVIVCALGCWLALRQDSQGLAAGSFAGGFAVPVLLGGEGSSIGLFGYYAVLNLAILFIAHRRSWRMINLIGFVATFGVATAWGLLRYTPATYASSQAFLALFIGIYVVAAILYARNTPGRLGNFVDSTLLFGPALIGFGLQVGLVRSFENGDAISAVAFGVFYLGLAALLWRRTGPGFALLVGAMTAIGIGFVTAAVPLALGARWTASAWAIEGAAAYWVGLRQSRWLPRVFGLALVGVSALIYLGTIGDNVAALAGLGQHVIGALTIAAALLAIAWWLRPGAPRSQLLSGEQALPEAAFIAGFGFVCLAIGLEVTRRVPAGDAAVTPALQSLLFLLGVAASAALATFAGRKFAWPVATWPGRVLLVPVAIVLVARLALGEHVLAGPDGAIWLAVAGLHVSVLWANDHDAGTASGGLLRIAHVGSVWVGTLVLADIIWFGIDRGGLWHTAWAAVLPLLGGIAVLAILAAWGGRSGATGWPRDRHANAYYRTAATPIALWVYFAAMVAAVVVRGHAAPLPYIPLLNPLEVTLGLAVGVLVFWQRTLEARRLDSAGNVTGNGVWVMLAVLVFVVVNTAWLRIAHHLLGVEWSAGGLLGSPVVQTGISILWTLLALASMLAAHRRVLRGLWLTGAGLLGAVVVKLLLLDLSATGDGQRIVAFVVVGVLMLVVGYFVPLPPRAAEAD